MNGVYSEGYYYGVLDVYFALMSTEDSAAAKPTYGTPEVLGKSIQVTITPQYKEGSVYASNVATRKERRVDSYQVSLNLDQIAYAKRQAVLGRKVDSNGVQIITGDQVAPNVAILFALTLDDGSRELWVLYKGKFSEITQQAQTDSDSMNYQHPTIEGTFVRREADNALAAIVNTEADGVSASVVSGWFAQVYESPAEVANPSNGSSSGTGNGNS